MTSFLRRLGRPVTLETPYAAFPGQPEYSETVLRSVTE